MIKNLYFNSQKRRWRGRKIALDQILSANKINSIREILLEKLQNLIRRFERIEHRMRHEQRARKRAILIWQSDQHKVTPRPNMQMFGRHLKLAFIVRRYSQL